MKPHSYESNREVLKIVQTLLRLLNGFCHLFESRPAFAHSFFDGMVRVEHDVDVFFKQPACLFELFKRQAAEINALFRCR